METGQFLISLLKANRSMVRKAMDGLSDAELASRPTDDTNSMLWLLWHISRVEDGIVSELNGSPLLWAQGWAEKCDVTAPEEGIGFGHKAEELAAFRVGSTDALKEYFGATEKKLAAFLETLNPEDLDRQVPAMMGEGTVDLAAPLRILINEALVHGGQMAYLRGLHKGMGWYF